MKPVLRLLLVLTLVATLSPALMAADQAQTKDYESFSLGELYVTGEKLPTSVEVTQTYEITAEQIEATHSRTVAEALSYAPGIIVTTGRKNQPNVGIHGFNQSKSLVLIDGVPYYETNFGSLDLNTIPVDNIAKIEVQKGVSSVLYGPNGLAGIINIITKKPTSRPSLDARVEIGDYESRRFAVSHGMKAGIFNYWIGYDHLESDGWYLSRDFDPRQTRIRYVPPPNRTVELEDGGVRENADIRMDAFWAKVGIEPTKDSEYYVNFHYITREKGAPASLLDDQNRVFTSFPAFSQLWRMPRYDNWGADLSGQQKIGDRVTLKGKLFYHEHVDDLDSFFNPDYTGFLSTSRYKDNMLGGSLLTDIKLAPIDTLRIAFNYRRDDHKERGDESLPFQEAVSYTGSVGVENEFNPIKNLSIVAGVGYDWFDVSKSTTNIITGGSFAGQGSLRTLDDDQVSPMVGVTYTFDDGTKLFGSWARKIRFPTLQALYSGTSGNPDLKAEKSENYILGVSRGITQYARGEVSFFSYDVKDLISRDAPGPISTYLNFGKVVIYGFEVIGEFFPTKDLSFRLGYTYEDATDKSPGRVTNRVTFIPEHKLDLSARYLIPGVGVNVDLTGLYVSRIWGQLPTGSQPNTVALRTGDYFILDARLSKMVSKNFEVYLAAKNIFDKDYESEVGFPAPGRNFFAGVKYSY